MNDLHNLYTDNINQITRLNASKNCPNCGAPVESEKCPYCGSIFIDFACLDADKPFYIKVKHDGKIVISKVRLTSISTHRDYTCLYADNSPTITMESGGEIEINLAIC